MNGLLFIKKPIGISSFDCIRELKKNLPPKIKIGHSGALDPFADGLMIIGIGSGTKQLENLLGETKTYTATAKIGELTDTLDSTGKITQSSTALLPIDFMECAQKLMPSYHQTPPLFSNIKIDGQPLRRLARKKKLSVEKLTLIAEGRGKECTISDFSLGTICWPFVTFTATVSKGTYIRSLANDIANQGETVATLYRLTRTRIGNISIEHAESLDNITDSTTIESLLRKNDSFLR